MQGVREEYLLNLADNLKVSLADVRALDEWRDVIPEYVKDYVSLNAFAA
ncbi:MAG: hypothetical protein HYR55_17170 [Acidobacteria bacterium]|nr:hypothetical protein [Acidobacteriota bacterium]